MYLKAGTLLQGGKYEIVRFISSGGFGCTYEARNTAFGSTAKTVAIKEFFVKDFCNRDTVSNDILVASQSKVQIVEKLKAKFVEEAKALYAMQHPNIVRVVDLFDENGTSYYVMDYIDGRSLAVMVEQDGPFSESDALYYIRQVAETLDYVHSCKRLHLDVKPQNIMVDAEGRSILIDFGVSKQYDEVNGENTSTLLGSTPGYAPIEQVGNCMFKFSPSSDIYSLGATLYKLLTGVVPVPANQRASGTQLPPLPSGVSASTRNAVDRAMRIVMSERPQNISEFISLLDGASVSPMAVGQTGDDSIGFSGLNPVGDSSTEVGGRVKCMDDIQDSKPVKKSKAINVLWIVMLLGLLSVALFLLFMQEDGPKQVSSGGVVAEDVTPPFVTADSLSCGENGVRTGTDCLSSADTFLSGVDRADLSSDGDGYALVESLVDEEECRDWLLNTDMDSLISAIVESDRNKLVVENGLTKLKGTVVDENGGPLIGATVCLVNTGIGSLTDMDGKFVFDNIPSHANKIRVSYVGMETVEVPVSQTGEMLVVLHDKTVTHKR